MNAEIFARIKRVGVIGIIRANSADEAVKAAIAAIEGGISVIEMTMTTPGAISAMQEIKRTYGHKILVGMGTVKTPKMAEEALAFAAQFVVSPITTPSVVQLCNTRRVCIIPGAFEPTRVYEAWTLGVDAVKIFPTSSVGPQYIRDLKAPFPEIPIVPTGGVTVGTAGDFIRAGADAVGAGSALFNPEAIAKGDFKALTKLAEQFVAAVEAARKG